MVQCVHKTLYTNFVSSFPQCWMTFAPYYRYCECAMVIGACRITLRLPESHSLKEKRQVVQSVLARLRNRFHLAVAEVDDQESWQIATLGLVCVSNSAVVADEVLTRVEEYLVSLRVDAMVIDVTREVTHLL